MDARIKARFTEERAREMLAFQRHLYSWVITKNLTGYLPFHYCLIASDAPAALWRFTLSILADAGLCSGGGSYHT